MHRPIVTLTTDFGPTSSYVAQMKGVLLTIEPELRIVDVTHSVPPQDVRYGACVLAEIAEHFPVDAIHVAVVDPGVGTDRPLACASCGGRRFLAPDNGLFDRVLRATPLEFAVVLRESTYWSPRVSRTFHGRDILAPVAARIAQGLDPRLLGPAYPLAVRLAWSAVRPTTSGGVGEVERVDSFGNLLTNIEEWEWGERLRRVRGTIRCGKTRGIELVGTYGERPEGAVVALFGSSGRLEIAVVNGNAARQLDCQVGAEIEWYSSPPD